MKKWFGGWWDGQENRGTSLFFVIELAGEGDDSVRTDLSYTLGQNLENLTLGGSEAGNELNNQVTGNAADNRLEGLAGNDTLDGGLGASGGAVNDAVFLERIWG